MPPLQALLLSSLKAPHASSRSPRVALHEASWAAAIRPTAPHRALGLPLCPFRGNGPCSLLAPPPKALTSDPESSWAQGDRGPSRGALLTSSFSQPPPPRHSCLSAQAPGRAGPIRGPSSAVPRSEAGIVSAWAPPAQPPASPPSVEQPEEARLCSHFPKIGGPPHGAPGRFPWSSGCASGLRSPQPLPPPSTATHPILGHPLTPGHPQPQGTPILQGPGPRAPPPSSVVST